MMMQTSFANTRYTTNDALGELGRRVVQQVESIPGVLGASPTITAPMVSMGVDLPFTIEAKPPSGGDRYNGDVDWRFIGPHFFATLAIPIRKGRVFTEQDNGAASKVVIINEAMAKKYWPNEEPVGQRIVIGKGLGPQFEDPPREMRCHRRRCSRRRARQTSSTGHVRADESNVRQPDLMGNRCASIHVDYPYRSQSCDSDGCSSKRISFPRQSAGGYVRTRGSRRDDPGTAKHHNEFAERVFAAIAATPVSGYMD